MSTTSKTDATYVLGHPADEDTRLSKLGQLLYPSTRHLFERAGIAPGMKVLDVGSGAGDVALLLAELVGDAGAVVGVDMYPTVLEAARARVQAAELKNVTFIAGDIRNVAVDDNFDAVVGRNILMYVADPAEVLRTCASHVRPGGVIAFQEAEWSILERVGNMPSVTPMMQQMTAFTIEGFRKAGTQMQMGFKFPGLFLEAGLPLPQIVLDGITGTEAADWVGYAFLTDTLRDVLPKLREYGILSEDLDSAAYIARVQAEIARQHSLLPLMFMAGAWTRKV